MRRRELLDIAGALAGSFVSRNNDTDGYWSLGLLRSFANDNQLHSLRFDILTGGAQPRATLLLRVSEAYRQHLVRQLTIRKIEHDVVAAAAITLTMEDASADAMLASIRAAPFACAVRLTDWRGRDFERVVRGSCAPHDPRRELRSGRAKTGIEG